MLKIEGRLDDTSHHTTPVEDKQISALDNNHRGGKWQRYMSGTHTNQGSKREREVNTPSPETNTKKPNMEKSNDDLYQAILNLQTGITTRMDNLEDHMKMIAKDINEKWEEKEKKWQMERAEMINHQKSLEGRLNELERRDRRNNAIITGLPIDNTTDAKNTVNKYFAHLDRPVQVNEAYEIKQQGGAGKIVIKFQNFADKMLIYKQKKSLMTTDGKSKVYINDDRTRREQEIEFHGRMLAKKLRKENKTVKMGYERLQVDGQWMIWDSEARTFTSQKN